MRAGLAVLVSALLVCPPDLTAGPSEGVVQGTVTLDGRPLSGMELSLVDVVSGAIHTTKSGQRGTFELSLGPGSYVVTGRSVAKSGQRGTFELSLGPGSYVVTGRSVAGVTVGRGPTLVNVGPGEVASADLEFVTVAARVAQEPPAQDFLIDEGLFIDHEPISCVLAGEHPILELMVDPSDSVARVSAFFRSSLSDEWYFVDLQQEAENLRGWLPRPQLAASPLGYYVQVTTVEFAHSRTAEYAVQVVEFEDDCEDGLVAAYGDPATPLTLYSATTGGVVTMAAGFAAGGAALGAGAIAAIVAGAGAVVAGAAAAVGGDETTTTTTTSSTAPPSTTTPTTTPPVIPQYILTLALVPAQGTVNVRPVGELVSDRTWRYDEGASVTLSAVSGDIGVTPPTVLCFDHWEGACQSFSTPGCVLTMTGDLQTTAFFEEVGTASCPN